MKRSAMSVGNSRIWLLLVAELREFQSGTKAILAGSTYLAGVCQMTMETQVVSMEDEEAYSVDAGTDVFVYIQKPAACSLVNGRRGE